MNIEKTENLDRDETKSLQKFLATYEDVYKPLYMSEMPIGTVTIADIAAAAVVYLL